MNKKFVLALLSSPVLFMSMLSMVMMARPVHAGQTMTPVGTHLSCVRSPYSAALRQVCIRVDNATPETVIQVAQVQPRQTNQTNKNQPNEPEELVFTEADSDAAIKLFGCDCPSCISSVRQLNGLPPLPV